MLQSNVYTQKETQHAGSIKITEMFFSCYVQMCCWWNREMESFCFFWNLFFLFLMVLFKSLNKTLFCKLLLSVGQLLLLYFLWFFVLFIKVLPNYSVICSTQTLINILHRKVFLFVFIEINPLLLQKVKCDLKLDNHCREFFFLCITIYQQ